MEKLWEYQTADLALTRFENQLRKSPTREQLLAVRAAMVDQQNRAKKLEEELKAAYAECARIGADIETVTNKVAELHREAENCAQDLRQVRLVIKAMDECNKTLSAMYKQMAQINTMATGSENTLKDIRTKLVSGKKEFDTLKEAHDGELAAASEQLAALKSAVESQEPAIEKPLLAQYKKVKKTRINPVALVKDNQCSGCNMAIPSLAMSKLKAHEGTVECDSCGRILYYLDK